MKDHPILFSTEMVEAIISGRKTQTRRVFKDHPRLSSDLSKVDLNKWIGEHPDYIYSFCPYGKPGDILWVRETWRSIGFDASNDPTMFCQYRDEVLRAINVPKDHKLFAQLKWKPSIHMPKAVARIWLLIEDIRIERLHNISEQDAIAEGIEARGIAYRDYLSDRQNHMCSPVASFQTLWESINGVKIWNENPWVWVIKFKILSITGFEDIIQLNN